FFVVLLALVNLESAETRGDHLGEAPSAGSGPVEAANELPVEQDRVALVDRLDGRTADRGVPRRDREGEETSTRLRNGDTQFGDLITRQHTPGDRIGRHSRRTHY